MHARLNHDPCHRAWLPAERDRLRLKLACDREAYEPERQALLRERAEMLGLAAQAQLMRMVLMLRAFNPNQPRVPAGNRDGGQWTDDARGAGNGGRLLGGVVGSDGLSPIGRESGLDRASLAADVTGFTKHGVNQAINRGVAPSAIRDAVANPLKVVPRPDGSTRYVGKNAVVVLNPAGEVITVWRQ